MSDKRSAIVYLLRAECPAKKISSRSWRAMITSIASFMLLSGLPTAALAQEHSTSDADNLADSYWKKFTIGAGVSLLAHESAHILTALALGFQPHVGLDHGRATVFSGIDSRRYPHKQFLFSAAGLTPQGLIVAAIFAIPDPQGGADKPV